MKVTRIATGYYKITNNTNTYQVSYEDMQRLWIVEVEVDNSKWGMMNSLEHVVSLPTLRDCKLTIEDLNN